MPLIKINKKIKRKKKGKRKRKKERKGKKKKRSNPEPCSHCWMSGSLMQSNQSFFIKPMTP